MLYRINIPTNKTSIGTQKPSQGVAERLHTWPYRRTPQTEEPGRLQSMESQE